ncbi:hypothetical protein PoB_003034600 [Plakobranchus ocellatus]|uniref:Uncharacterized protein n=1 Tax=Plakobranchus ocellatus TaxID=259542 RepID=A0AAV4AB18_9GAST|nr:hypothetical protein PoB_003034600 [Plakobranchus ocellatus]
MRKCRIFLSLRRFSRNLPCTAENLHKRRNSPKSSDDCDGKLTMSMRILKKGEKEEEEEDAEGEKEKEEEKNKKEEEEKEERRREGEREEDEFNDH